MNTSQEFYRHSGITYKGLRLLDVDQTDISRHFPEVSTEHIAQSTSTYTLYHQVVAFIDDCVSRGGKVMGHSRLQSAINICIPDTGCFFSHRYYLISC